MGASVLARDPRLRKRPRPPSGLSWAATTALTGRLVSTASTRAPPASRVIAWPRIRAPAPARVDARFASRSVGRRTLGINGSRSSGARVSSERHGRRLGRSLLAQSASGQVPASRASAAIARPRADLNRAGTSCVVALGLIRVLIAQNWSPRRRNQPELRQKSELVEVEAKSHDAVALRYRDRRVAGLG